ncbi:uncharacterized protein isoform X1 [Danio rerio]|uniref:Uncharacterized protein isoform X1 n=9 Tax=Danio rerio TaxID=7955 RepID=A0AC58JH27_DANRE
MKTLSSVCNSQSLTAMEMPRLTIIALMFTLISHKQISGEEVVMNVKAGENITLYCDRSVIHGFMIVWIRNCSHKNQPSLVMDYRIFDTIKHFRFVHNPASNSYDLHITNISVSDLGLYYCANVKNSINKNERGVISGSAVYNNGNRTTRLSFAETSCSELLNSTSTPPAVSKCVFCWNLLFSVCSLCVLLFSICVYCLCQKKTTGSPHDQKCKLRGARLAEGNNEQELCYVSLDVRTRRQIQHKKTQDRSSEFSIYSQVNYKT